MNLDTLRAGLEGLLFGAGLIIAIGAQNSYVLRQGIRKRFLFETAMTSSLADAFLIFLGIGGLGYFLSRNATLYAIATWGGIIFLVGFGLRAFHGAVSVNPKRLNASAEGPQTAQKAVATALGFSLLNPHVYLDTVVLIGALGATYPLWARTWFGAGAILASFLWFFGLAYGAAQLAPWLNKPLTSRLLDGAIAIIMWWIGGNLLLEQVLSF
jgi:L-lysine exporter family protein LysE/ArgO